MTGAAVLCAAGWVAGGLSGAPFDPFVPLAAAVSLRSDWSVGLRVAAAIALGPLAAAACGDVVVERTALYATLALVATHGGTIVRDSVTARTGLVAAGLGAALSVRAGLSAAGALPPPSESLGAFAGSVLWTAAHAGLCLVPARLLARWRAR